MSDLQDETLNLDAENLYEVLNQLIRAHQFRDRDRICGHDISVAQCYALETLIKQGSMRLQSLADEMYLDKSSTSRVIDSLERKGYVIRLADEEDRRAIQIRPTSRGQALYQAIRAELIAEERALIAMLSPETRQATLHLLRQLTKAAKVRCGMISGESPGQ